MTNLLATLVIYRHTKYLEYYAIYRTKNHPNRRLFTGVQASYTPVHLYNILVITHVLGFASDLDIVLVLEYNYCCKTISINRDLLVLVLQLHIVLYT